MMKVVELVFWVTFPYRNTDRLRMQNPLPGEVRLTTGQTGNGLMAHADWAHADWAFLTGGWRMQKQCSRFLGFRN